MEELPLTEVGNNTVKKTRDEAIQIVKGKDDRLLVICGPCSIHDTKAALEYGAKFKEAAKTFKDDLLLVMRVYFEKPRTTVGWKGLINDPYLNGRFDLLSFFNFFFFFLNLKYEQHKNLTFN